MNMSPNTVLASSFINSSIDKKHFRKAKDELQQQQTNAVDSSTIGYSSKTLQTEAKMCHIV